MRKKLWIYLALLVVIPGLLFTVSCAKKVTQAEPSAEETAAEPEVDNAARIAEEKAAQEEAARQWEMASEEDIADQAQAEAAAKVAKENSCPLAVKADGLDALAELTPKIADAGVE